MCDETLDPCPDPDRVHGGEATLHGCSQEDEGVPLGDVLHLALQVKGLLRGLSQVLEDGFAALP